MDRDDLNRLLAQEQYQNVERTHYKLWLSSTNVLTGLVDEIVHRDILTESSYELEEIKSSVKVFVQNPSFVRAIDILDKFRYVLISGEPGIGKTTLGRSLVAYFLQRKGYQDFIYANTVGIARKRYKENEKQIFFFDDFWGDTFKDEKFPHNEEKHLLRFIKQVSESSNKILILASREYVLQQGMAEYQNEQLSKTLNIGKCFLQLEDYSELIRTKILFNHLYFSRLEWNYVRIIAERYEEIINHPNYNPRIIETFLDQGSVLFEESAPVEFFKEFLNYLNEPLDFWKNIFMKQTFGAKIAALILFLSSQPMRLMDLKSSYYSCIEAGGQINILDQGLEFDSIVTQLEKTMIKTYYQRTSSTILVKFQNPSIKDFLYQHLANNILYYGKMFIQGCPFINQLFFMFNATSSTRSIYDISDDDIFYQKMIHLPENLVIILRDRIISDFDILKYSYPERDVFERMPCIDEAPEDCIVKKLEDVIFHFGVNENPKMDEFIKDKIQYLASLIHEEDYPLSYDDMVAFPGLIQEVIPLKIKLDRNKLINDFYERSRFAEHVLACHQFRDIFPEEFSEFYKINYKTIKRKIKYILLDDIDFFASNGEYDRIDWLIDIVYPEILERFKLRDSKTFRKELKINAGYLDEEDQTSRLNAVESNERKSRAKEEQRKKQEEMINIEKDSLLGKSEEILDQDIVDFIENNAQSASEARALVLLFESETPWFIQPFYSNWNRVSVLMAYYREKKKFPSTSALFYEEFASYLCTQINQLNSATEIESMIDMFSEFAFEMMKKGQIIFSERTLANYPVFKNKLESGAIDLPTILAFPFIVQRGKWYEFQTLLFQSYLSLKSFLSSRDKKKTIPYKEFLNLRDAFIDSEHDIWVMCSELDLQYFNQQYLLPILNNYLTSVDATSSRTLCTSTLSFFDLKLNFKIPQDTFLPDYPGSCCNGLEASAFEFVDLDLLSIELYLSSSEMENTEENHSNLLRFSQFVIENGSKSDEDEYELDFKAYGADPKLLDILEALGVCDFVENIHRQVLLKIETAVNSNFCSRLDSYITDPKTRRFVSND